ncbi:MAG: TetR/AcrR family transcriptional regulator [Sphingomonadaceae bacterium]
MALSPEAREARCRVVVDAAHALVRETGGAGFSMLQLAKRAGVSPATPYNLLGSKGEVLRRVVQDEYASFAVRLEQLPQQSPLDRLLAAVDLIAVHYTAEPEFYRGLYAAMTGGEANPLRDVMSQEGQHLWGDMVGSAIEAGELAPLLGAEDLTGLLLRSVAGTVEAWLAESWDDARFAAEMRRVSRLLVLGLVDAKRAAELKAALA